MSPSQISSGDLISFSLFLTILVNELFYVLLNKYSAS